MGAPGPMGGSPEGRAVAAFDGGADAEGNVGGLDEVRFWGMMLLPVHNSLGIKK